MTTLPSIVLLVASVSVAACMAADEEPLEPDLTFPDESGGGDDGEELPDGGDDEPGKGDETDTPTPPPEPTSEIECEPGFEPFGEVCKLQGSSKWDLVIHSATIPAETPAGWAWDPFGGDPDAYVVVTFGPGVEVKTSTVANSLNPTWNETVEEDVRASELKSMFHLALYDGDPDFEDLIAECDVPLADDLFDGGTYVASDLDAGCPDVQFSLVDKN